jgi:hypothetical protein
MDPRAGLYLLAHQGSSRWLSRQPEPSSPVLCFSVLVRKVGAVLLLGSCSSPARLSRSAASHVHVSHVAQRLSVQQSSIGPGKHYKHFPKQSQQAALV